MPGDDPKYLNISDAMGRDIDAGRMAGKDIVDLLPDHVAQEIWDASSPSPVHAENLVPISKRQARDISHPGGIVSADGVPKTRRVIPAPYQRDRVTGGKHGKSWHLGAVGEVQCGDIITDVGLVVRIDHLVVYEPRSSVSVVPESESPGSLVATGIRYQLHGAGGNILELDAGAQVKYFR